MENKNAQLKLSLQSFGFSAKESDVYFALLELGGGTVTEISRKAGINRTTGYDILDSLASKGMINISGKEPKQEYSVESPDALKRYLEKQSALIAEHIEKSAEVIPRLKSIQTLENRPKIKFYEGTEGLRSVYEDTLTSSETILAYACIDDMHRALPDYFPGYYMRRAKNNISIRGIVPKTKSAIERAEHNKEEKREITFVPADKYYFSPEINIYDNKIMIASWREKLGIIIESAEIADAMKKIYELAWSGAKILNNATPNKPVEPN